MSGVAAGERIAVWRPNTVEPEARLRVLLPGEGTSARQRAAASVFVPSVQQATERGGRSTGRRVVVRPGDPTGADLAMAWLRGHPGSSPVEAERARRLGLIPRRVTEVGDALVELGCWRSRVESLAPGPDLVAALADRPDTLAPAPLNDPDEALAVAVRAGKAGVGDRVVTGWANAVLDSVIARTRVLSWLQAEQYSDLALLSRNYPGLHEMLPTEVAMALRTSESAAGNAITTARVMTQRLPGTLQALHAGVIDDSHAMALARATATTTAEVAGQVETDLLPLLTAPGSTITAEQLRRRAGRRVIALDPAGAKERHRVAAADRRITRWAEDDGMAGLKVIAPAQQVAEIWEAATALADAAKHPGDTRTLGARRVDALADVCSDILHGQPTPLLSPGGTAANGGTSTTPGQDVNSGTSNPDEHPDPAADTGASTPNEHPDPETGVRNIRLDAGPDTDSADGSVGQGCALDLGDPVGPAGTAPADSTPGTATESASIPSSEPPGQPDRLRHWPSLPARHGRRPHIMVVVPYTVLLGADDPCELVGHGAITADQARPIIADGVLRRLLCDPASGTVLDYGRTRYEPPESLKQFIAVRDVTCRTPGCVQPADRCQIDHVEPYKPGQPTGGKTNHTGLDGKCLHHHRAKDGGGFANSRDEDGTSHWTTPLGRHYTLPPNRVRGDEPDHDDGLAVRLGRMSRESTDRDRGNDGSVLDCGTPSPPPPSDETDDDAPPF